MKAHTWCRTCKKWHANTRHNEHPKPQPKPQLVDELLADPAKMQALANELETE